MKRLIVLFISCLLVVSCRDAKKHDSAPPPTKPSLRSQEIGTAFPLLPLVEKQLWQELLSAETVAHDPQSNEQQRTEAVTLSNQIADRLEKKYPFRADDDGISLGAIRYHKASQTIEIPAVVHFPVAGSTEHPNELELVLCSETGRTHETLFVTKAKPLHLELLLHLTGFKKTSPMSLFRMAVLVPNHDPIPIEELIAPAANDTLPEEMVWEFSGSDFDDLYSPDQTGDFMILWNAHAAVLRIQQEKIASGEIKLMAKQHPLLPRDREVILLLTPAK